MITLAYTLLKTNPEQTVASDRMTVMLSALADLAAVSGQPVIQAGLLLAAVMSATAARSRPNGTGGSNKIESINDSDQTEINKRRTFYAAARLARQRQRQQRSRS